MKKVRNISWAIAVLVLGSCSDDFLDTEPLTSLTDENFYQTIEDADAALVGCYDGVQQIYSNGVAFPVASEVFSDNCFGGTGSSDAFNYKLMDEFDASASPGDINVFNGSWEAYYRAIYRANVLLQKMDQINWSENPDHRNEVEAEARFLRAYSYFDMVRLWERVPLLTEPTVGNVGQSEANEIYEQIVEDLRFAVENASAEVSPGRVNRWVAKAYLARVYLFYTGYYEASDLFGLTREQVLQGLEEVIATGSYGLVSEFKDLWPAASATPDEENNTLVSTYAGKDNRETVFAIKYNITSNYDGDTDGNHWLVFMGFRGHTFSPYGTGWGACSVLPALYNAYDGADTRRDASIIGIDEEGLNYDNSGQREYTGYQNKKYITLANPDGQDVVLANGATDFQIGQYQDYIVMRYADVLLMAAELGSGSAQDYFDQVRQRAYGTSFTALTVNQENILEERRLEFAFEGIRYWDLLRQGVEAAASAIAVETMVMNGGIESGKQILASNLVAKRGFQQIPQNQISRSNGLIEQNGGWSR